MSVLAEDAVTEDEVTEDWLSERIETARDAVAEAGDDRRQIEAQRLADLQLIAGRI